MAGKEEKECRRRTGQRADGKEQETAAQRIQEGAVHTRCRKDKCCGVAQKRDRCGMGDVHRPFHLRPDPLPVDAEMETHHKEHQETEDAVQSMHPEWRMDSEERHRVRERETRQHDAEEKEKQKQVDAGHDDALLRPVSMKEGAIPSRIQVCVEKEERSKDKSQHLMPEIMDIAIVKKQKKHEEHRQVDRHSKMHGILLSVTGD